jgi:hypothetical protein
MTSYKQHKTDSDYINKNDRHNNNNYGYNQNIMRNSTSKHVNCVDLRGIIDENSALALRLVN